MQPADKTPCEIIEKLAFFFPPEMIEEAKQLIAGYGTGGDEKG
jgi:hypothetical protein